MRRPLIVDAPTLRKEIRRTRGQNGALRPVKQGGLIIAHDSSSQARVMED